MDAEEEEGVRKAAVALFFRLGENDVLELLFIKRAEYEGDPWSGQIAFPGGRAEERDASLAETAIRETREETGIDLAREGVMVGRLDDLRPRTVRLPAIMVRPFVALLDRSEPLVLSSEVALSFWLPFTELARGESWKEAFVFFKHEDAGTGPKLAARFLELCR